MRQQLVNLPGHVRWHPCQHVPQVCIGVMPVHARRLHQAHHRRRPLARAQAAGEQPVIATNGNRPDLVLDPVVVHRQLPLIDEARERHPTPEAVIQCPGRRRAVRHLVPLQCHPLVQRIEHRLAVLLSNLLALIGIEIFDIALDVVNLGELLQREPSYLTLVGRMQIEEFASGMRQATDFRYAVGKPGFVATEVITDQAALPVTQEGPCMLTGP